MKRAAWLCVRAGLGTPNRRGATLGLVLFSYLPAVLFATGSGGLVLPRGGAVATGLFAFQGLLLSWLLFGSLLDLAREMDRLRLPDHRSFLAATAALILGLTLLAPATLLLVVDRSGWQVLAVGLACGTGVVAAFLRGSSTRRTPWLGTAAGPASGGAARAARQRAFRAMRMALGPPYAPASWRQRLAQLGALCVALAGIPALALMIGTPLHWVARAEVFHAAELLGLLIAAGLCWVWPLYRVMVLLNFKRGALAELAVLPGLGDGGQQRRRLYRAVLAVPGVGLGTLLILALGVAWLQGEPLSVYVRLTVELVGLPLLTLPIALGLTAQRRTATLWGGGRLLVIQLVFQTCWYAYVVWVIGWAWPMLSGRLRWIAIPLFSAVLIVLLGFSLYHLRKFARRPHPFVEVAG